MARRKSPTLMQAMGGLLAERLALQKREQKLIRNVNTMLRKIGYEVVPREKALPRSRRQRSRRGPGRPSGKPTATRRKRRGRPRKKT